MTDFTVLRWYGLTTLTHPGSTALDPLYENVGTTQRGGRRKDATAYPAPQFMPILLGAPSFSPRLLHTRCVATSAGEYPILVTGIGAIRFGFSVKGECHPAATFSATARAERLQEIRIRKNRPSKRK